MCGYPEKQQVWLCVNVPRCVVRNKNVCPKQKPVHLCKITKCCVNREICRGFKWPGTFAGPGNAQLTYSWSLLLWEHIRRLNGAQRRGWRKPVWAESLLPWNRPQKDRRGQINWYPILWPPAHQHDLEVKVRQIPINYRTDKFITRCFVKCIIIRPVWSWWFIWTLPTSNKKSEEAAACRLIIAN